MSIFRTVLLGTLLSVFGYNTCAQNKASEKRTTIFYKASNTNFQYTGRIDFSNPELPRFWAPGVYIKAVFSGPECEILINDEMLWGSSHNYISVVVDNQPAKRIKLSDKINLIKVAQNLSEGKHTLLVSKSTESGIGFLEFVGIRCEKLLKPEASQNAKLSSMEIQLHAALGAIYQKFPAKKLNGTINIMRT